MALLKYFSYLITTSLVVLAAFFHSAPFAYASVVSFMLMLGYEGFQVYIETKNFKNSLPEEAKRKLQDIEARVTSIELGIQRRGF